MTYRLPEDIKRIVYAMADPYPYLKPDPKRCSYKYNRKKFRKHGFWLSVCWDLDWAVILYITAAVSIDNPTATDADGDSILATLKSIIARENAWFDFDNDVSVETEKENIIHQELVEMATVKDLESVYDCFINHLGLMTDTQDRPLKLTVDFGVTEPTNQDLIDCQKFANQLKEKGLL